jgi:IS5 family transposase
MSGYLAMGGQIVDATIVAAPKQRNTNDRCHRLIRKWTATDAAAYDGARLADVLDRENTASEVWADTAYRSAKNEDHLTRHGFVSCIHRKKPKGRPMAERTRNANARKSKVRSAVEHVFAYQKGPMVVLVVRTIGIARARVAILREHRRPGRRRPMFAASNSPIQNRVFGGVQL